MNRLIIIAFTAGLLSSFLGGTLGIMAASTFQDTERTEAVFVYGTLMNPITRAYACVCWTGLRPETLDGYVKTLRNIVPAENSRVRGGVITVTPNRTRAHRSLRGSAE